MSASLAAEAEAPPPPPVDAVQVHLETTSTAARLLRASGGEVCAAPCDASVQRSSDAFVIGGVGVTRTQPFAFSALQPTNDIATLKVKPGSAGWHAAGLGGLIAGGAGFVGGLAVLVVGLFTSSNCTGGSVTCGAPIVNAGLITMLAASVLVAVGLPLFFLNQTVVTFSDGATLR